VKISTLIRYLKVHAAPIKAGQTQARSRLDYITFLDEAIQECAKVLIEQREPWLLRVITFNVTAAKKDYVLSVDIATGGLLGGRENIARPAALHILDEGGTRWVRHRILNHLEAMEQADPSTTTHWPVARWHVGTGGGMSANFEGDYILTIENPPAYTKASGGRLAVLCLPSILADDVADAFEPALPAYAWGFVKRHALRQMYLADGNTESYAAMEQEMVETERRLRAGAGGGMSEDPEYVHDVRAGELEGPTGAVP